MWLIQTRTRMGPWTIDLSIHLHLIFHFHLHLYLQSTSPISDTKFKAKAEAKAEDVADMAEIVWMMSIIIGVDIFLWPGHRLQSAMQAMPAMPFIPSHISCPIIAPCAFIFTFKFTWIFTGCSFTFTYLCVSFSIYMRRRNGNWKHCTISNVHWGCPW